MIERGMSVPEISDERNLKETTIYSHISQLFKTGRLNDVSKFVSFEEFKKIEGCLMKTSKEGKLKPIFDALEGKVEYGKIRLVIQHLGKKK